MQGNTTCSFFLLFRCVSEPYPHISTHVDVNDITTILKTPSHSGSFTLSLNHRGNLPEFMKMLVTLNPHLLHNIFVLNHTVCSPELPFHETFLSVLWLYTSGCLANLVSVFLATHCVQVICACVIVSRVPLRTVTVYMCWIVSPSEELLICEFSLLLTSNSYCLV